MSIYDTLMDFLCDETCLMLGMDVDPTPSNIFPLNSVADAAGLKDNTKDYIFYLISPIDYDINRQVDTINDDNTGNDNLVNRVTRYTRTWRFKWEFYGPNGLDNANKIRFALLTDNDRHTEFKNQSLFVIPDIPSPVFVPDPINLQWYQRWDLYADFNEAVVDTQQTSVIASTQIVVEDEKGEIGECSI